MDKSPARKNFIVLLALNQENAAAGKAVAARLAAVDPTCKAAWLDSRGAGVFVSTALGAHELMKVCFPEGRPDAEREAFRDALILQIGPDVWCRSESKVDAWLQSHRMPSDAPDPKA